MSPHEAGTSASFATLSVIALALAIYANTRQPDTDAPIVAVAREAPAPLAPAPEPEPEPAPAAVPGQPLQLGRPFVDRFDRAELGDRWYVAHGWSNGAHTDNDWRADQVTLTQHGLGMGLSRSVPDSDYAFAGSEVQTPEVFRYGYFEFRVRVPKDPGIVTGLFTYAHHGANGERPQEIDIEFVGRDTRRVELTYHRNFRPTHKKIKLDFDASEGFHSYAFDWRPDRISWYVDNVLVHEVGGPGVALLNRPQQIMIHQWASTQLEQWVGKLDPDGGPWRLDVACVAYAPSYEGRMLCDDDTPVN